MAKEQGKRIMIQSGCSSSYLDSPFKRFVLIVVRFIFVASVALFFLYTNRSLRQLPGLLRIF